MPAQGEWMDIGRLHVITDTAEVARAVCTLPGVTVQLRCKGMSDRDVSAVAGDLVARGAHLVVNDRVDIALAACAAGVHLGADDLPVAVAGRIAGDRLVIGATVRSPDAARLAVEAGADYVGAGPAYRSTTKAGLPAPLGPEGIASIAAAAHVPVIAIGGVTARLAPGLVAAGAYGVAVIAAVQDAPDPVAAASAILDAIGAGV